MNTSEDFNQQDIWSPLFESTTSYRLSRKALNELILFAEIPPTLVSLGTIAARLIAILQRVTAILAVEACEDQELLAKIPSWVECCETIVANRNEIEQIIPNFFLKGLKANQNPLGATLWCQVKDPKLTNPYLLLQAYLCLSYYDANRLEIARGLTYKNAKAEACMAVRNLAKPHLASILRELPVTPLPLKTYRDALKSWQYDRNISRLRALFTDAITGRKGITHVDRISRKRSSLTDELPFESNEQVINFSEDDDVQHAARLSTLTVPSLSEAQLSLQQKTLCAREEFTSPREALLIEHEGPDPSGGFNRSQYQLMARGYAAAMSMHNQKLASDWERLTPYEIQQFLAMVSEMAIKDDSRIGEMYATELAAFLAVIFWTSITPEEACNCTLVPSAARCTVQLGIQRGSNGPWNWVIKPRVPQQNLVPKHVLANQAIQPAPRYTLPMPPECVCAMERHVATLPGGSQETKIFGLLFPSYQYATALFFKNLRSASGGRQNEPRISLHLHELLARMPGSDITTAMSISGRNDNLGSVQLHYTANSVSRIKECYQTACADIRDDAGIKAVPKDAGAGDLVNDTYVGSRYVPRPETVKQLVADLRGCLSASRSAAKRDEHQMVELHNAMTVYTVQMIGFATGYRNVRDPLLQEAEIDRETNFAVISDKDDETFYNSRIIWLPDCCMKQLDLYNEHLELFHEWLFFYDQELFYQVREEAVTGRHVDRCNPSLFVIWKNRDNPLQPKVMKHLVRNVGYDLPGNANRHYLRTRLLARSCPVEVINAFMGHWSSGMEPWGRFSGLSPLDYRKELSDQIVELLKENDWKPEPGLERVL